MVALRYRISLLVFSSISHSLAALTCEISSGTREEKFHIHMHIHILYLYQTLSLGSTILANSKGMVQVESSASMHEDLLIME